MSIDSKHVTPVLLGITLVCSIVGIGCSAHHQYRLYDPYYTDYHVWTRDEAIYYRQWSNENHRDANRDFRRLTHEEQKEYWTWQHNHGDQDHDRNQDHREKNKP